MIDKIELYLPHWAIAAIVIAIAVGVIMSRGSDYSVCHSQKESFIQKQKNFVLSQNFKPHKEGCLESNNSGACGPYFTDISALVRDLSSMIEDSCVTSVISENGGIRKALSDFLSNVVKLAWDGNGPLSENSKSLWLNSEHKSIFCKVKFAYQKYYGMGSYKSLENTVLKSLSGKKNEFKFSSKKDKSLFSLICSNFI